MSAVSARRDPVALALSAAPWKAAWYLLAYRDVGYLLGAFVPLVTLGLPVLGCWLIFLAGITLPLWYWASHQPGYGVYIDMLPKALIAAAVSLVLFLREDPRKEAKDLLHRPGPLASFIQLSRTNRRYRPTREGPAHGWGPGTASSPA